MATNTYVALDKKTVTTAVASVEFTGISSGYTDLVIVSSIVTGSGTPGLYYQVGNGSIDTGSNYSSTVLLGTGSSAASYRYSNATAIYGNVTGDTAATVVSMAHFQNYSNTSTYKTVLCRHSSASDYVMTTAGLWRSTSAINAIKILAASTNTFAAGTTFSLYGIAAASVGAKATGGTIYADDTYYYHVFGSTGTFTPLQSLSADVLVVAGGGAGGGGTGGVGSGGGGAGGHKIELAQSLTTTSYSVTVGGGGSSVNTNINGNNGSNSSFSAITATAGGGGGTYGNPDGTAGNAGGSGGGGGTSGSGGSPAGGAASPSGQGNAGGAGGTGSAAPYRGGGGGGAGAVGASAAASGNGGVGISTYSSWSIPTGIGQNISGTYWLAGGGGAGGNPTPGTGGSGGGGTGANTAGANATSGSVNTGSGGGGACGVSGNSGAGGSGIVIVRYAK